MNHLDAAIALRICITDLTAVIRRSVIYQYQLKILTGLLKNAFNALSDILFHIVNRNNDTNLHNTHHVKNI